jgi:hypothetical protein
VNLLYKHWFFFLIEKENAIENNWKQIKIKGIFGKKTK